VEYYYSSDDLIEIITIPHLVSNLSTIVVIYTKDTEGSIASDSTDSTDSTDSIYCRYMMCEKIFFLVKEMDYKLLFKYIESYPIG
jgi:hypothetical protein